MYFHTARIVLTDNEAFRRMPWAAQEARWQFILLQLLQLNLERLSQRRQRLTLVTPLVTIGSGVAVSQPLAPTLGAIAMKLGIS